MGHVMTYETTTPNFALCDITTPSPQSLRSFMSLFEGTACDGLSPMPLQKMEGDPQCMVWYGLWEVLTNRCVDKGNEMAISANKSCWFSGVRRTLLSSVVP